MPDTLGRFSAVGDDMVGSGVMGAEPGVSTDVVSVLEHCRENNGIH